MTASMWDLTTEQMDRVYELLSINDWSCEPEYTGDRTRSIFRNGRVGFTREWIMEAVVNNLAEDGLEASFQSGIDYATDAAEHALKQHPFLTDEENPEKGFAVVGEYDLIFAYPNAQDLEAEEEIEA